MRPQKTLAAVVRENQKVVIANQDKVSLKKPKKDLEDPRRAEARNSVLSKHREGRLEGVV